MPKTTHGGKREGAGRPKLFEDLRSLSITIPEAALRRLDEWRERRGITSRSEAIRKLIGRLK